MDSDRRLELLRGGSPSTARDLPAHEGAPRKRVKHGHESVAGRGETLQPTQQHNNAPIVDRDGHIDLVSGHDQIDRSSKNRKPAEGNGQAVGMRLADAGGYGSRDSKPWYSTSAPEVRAGQFEVGRDVWGNEDVRRAHRDRQRIDKNDPLAAMKRGVKQLKQAEAERAEWKAQRESDLNEVEELAAKRSRRHSKHRRRRRESSAGSLEDFNLDEDDVEGRQRSERRDRISGHDRSSHRRHHHHHRSSHRHRSRERHRSRSPHLEGKA